MTPGLAANPPLFFSLLYTVIVGAIVLTDYPNQKYSLQRKNSNGFFVRIATFNEAASQDSVLKEYGPGYYILKACKPRFATIWKSLLGKHDQEGESKNPDKNHSQIQGLKRKTDVLALGVAATGIGELIGFPLVHLRFAKIEARVAQLLAAIQTIPVRGLVCSNCQTPLQYLLQPECSFCHVPMTWFTSP